MSITVNIPVTQGYGGDNYISSGAPTVNLGAYPNLALSSTLATRRALLRFDFSTIPAGATCESATLKLTGSANYASATYSLYPISSANGDWIPGTKNNATAGAGESCYNAKKADGAGGVTEAWAGLAGLLSPGVDYVNPLLSEVTSALTGGVQLEFPISNDGLAVIQSWFGQPTNNGILLFRNLVAISYFDSGESAVEAYRPIFSVTYSGTLSTKKFLFKK